MPHFGNATPGEGLGLPVGELVDAVKRAIKSANISTSDPSRDLSVTSVYLKLHTVATTKAGGGLDFRVPVIGMKVKIGGAVSRQTTHVMELTLVPEGEGFETRDAVPVDEALVDAVDTIRAVMSSAARGDEPFVLEDSSVELSFAVAKDSSISLGVEADLTDEITHTLKLTLARPT